MQSFGWTLFVVGALLAVYGLSADATTAVPFGFEDWGEGRTVNMLAMNIKTNFTNFGGALIIAGAVLAAANSAKQSAAQEEAGGEK